MDWVRQLPLIEGLAIMFVIALLRGNATYWVGRGVTTGVIRLSRHREPSPHRRRALARAQALISRWGVLAVPLSFLTVGLQTAVNATAGALKMPLRRYLPAVVVGAALWAVLWFTAGLAVIGAAIEMVLGSPWLLVALVLVAAGLGGWLLLRHRRQDAAVAVDPPAARVADPG